MDENNKDMVGFLERIVKMVSNYGFTKILKALVVIIVFAIVMYCALNIGNIFKVIVNNYHQEQTELHDAAIEKRKTLQPKINEILTELRNKVSADRAYVLELHNGTNNTSGLPFDYINMTYERVKENIDYIADDYNDITLSRFVFPYYLEKNHLWYGTTEELAEIDDRLAKRLSSNNTTYFAITTLNGLHSKIGYLGISYCNDHEPDSIKSINDNLNTAAQKLSILLDSE